MLMELTLVEIKSSNWCDMRLNRMFESLCILEPIFPQGVPWLLAHYKGRLHAKMKAFDEAGQLEGPHAVDQVSMNVSPRARDVRTDCQVSQY